MRPFDLPTELPLLETILTLLDAALLIIDPISTIFATLRPAQRLILLAQLADLAWRKHCAILLIRSIGTLSKTQLYSPTHLSTSAARDPLLCAARSRLLLIPHPSDEESLVLHCPKHSLSASPAALSLLIASTEQHQPILLWLGLDEDPSAEQHATTYSQHHQRLLETLRESETALDARTLSQHSLQSYHNLRKMLQRMLHAGQLVSPARGLYTTPGHRCLLHFPHPAVTNVESVPNLPDHLPAHEAVPTVVDARFIALHEDISPSPNSSSLSLPNFVSVPNPHAHLPIQHCHPERSEGSQGDNTSPISVVNTCRETLPTTIIDTQIIAPGSDGTPSPHPYHPAPEIPVPHVANVPTRSHEPTAEDLYPSVRIRPPKEPEIYPGW